MPENKELKSFSRIIKEEIFRTDIGDFCCVKAEFLGLILFGAQQIGKNEIKLITENSDVVGLFAELSRKLGIEAIVCQNSEKAPRYIATLSDSVKVAQLLYDLNLIDENGMVKNYISNDIVKKTCCIRAFLRGAFMGAGAVSDPNKNYNMEISSPINELSSELMKILNNINFDFRITARKNKYVIYVKNSEQISDILSFMGTYKAQMELLNIKIEKEIRNDMNRTVNSETSNLFKTINASVEQIKAIQRIENTIGLDSLPDDLREIAILRLENKELSLSELGSLLNPPLTKSGVNHRMKKILKFAN